MPVKVKEPGGRRFALHESVIADREAEAIVAGTVRRDSTLADFVARRADVLTDGFERSRETALLAFALKRIDLAPADGRLAPFFEDLGFTFAFIAMSPATYTDYAS